MSTASASWDSNTCREVVVLSSMGAHINFSREGQGTEDMASAVARAYNGGLGAAGSLSLIHI